MCPTRARSGLCAVTGKASGSDSMSETPLTKGCQAVVMDRRDQACRFLASLGFPFPLRGYSDEEHPALIPRAPPSCMLLGCWELARGREFARGAH
jgi:hypothetical protein